jgi:hypothetical protein
VDSTNRRKAAASGVSAVAIAAPGRSRPITGAGAIHQRPFLFAAGTTPSTAEYRPDAY